MSRADDARNRRLLFARELMAGELRPSQLARREVREAALSLRVPATLVRGYQERLARRGRLTHETRTEPRYAAARRAVLGNRAAAPPRLLVRLGTVPAGEPAEAFEAATALLTAAGVPHLVAVPGRDPDPDRLAELRHAGVELAASGTGAALPAAPKRLTPLLDAADAELARAAVRPDVFVVPEDRLPWRAWEALSGRYAIVCGGPGTLRTVGWHDGPAWRQDAVWTPAHPPFAGPAAAVAEAGQRLRARATGLWVPVALDWRTERPEGLERFAEAARELAAPWEDFLEEVRFSRRDAG